MSTTTHLLNQIISKKEILVNMIEKINIEKEANCLYRTGAQEHYIKKEIKQNIYENANKSEENIKEFFLEDSKDDVIINSKIDTYIEKNKIKAFYSGMIEINIFSKLQNINIIYIR